jgi:RimJ/RimL family protein N-acetyltransferase
VNLLVEYAFVFQNVRRVHLTVNGNNERAIRAYQACGFVHEGRLRAHVWSNGAYVDLLYMGVLRDEWEVRK